MCADAGVALGLIAGGGSLPLAVTRAAREHGRRVVAIAFHAGTDRRLDAEASQVTWLHPGELEVALETLCAAGVREAVLAGSVDKATLYAGPEVLRLDAAASELIATLRDRRDDSILAALAQLLEGRGIRLLPQAELVPELLAGEGPLGRERPDAAQRADVAFGWPIARAIAALDVGQTVVVKDGAVLAVEAIEGTDATIRRAGAIAPGACVIKLAKPQQDPRFDVPAVGPATVAALVEARVRVLAVEAGRTLVLDREAMIETADAHGIALLGVATEPAHAGPA